MPATYADQRPHEVVAKLVVVGDYRVGKTALIQRLLQVPQHEPQGSPWPDLPATVPTVGADFYSTCRPASSHNHFVNTRLQIWDTAGLERYAADLASTLAGATMVVCVFDVSMKRSLRRVMEHHIVEVADHLPDLEQNCIVVVGNKSDLCASSGNAADDSRAKLIERNRKRGLAAEGAFDAEASSSASEHEANGSTHEPTTTVDEAFLEVAATDVEELLHRILPDVIYAETSAVTGAGVVELDALICDALVKQLPHPQGQAPPSNTPSATSASPVDQPPRHDSTAAFVDASKEEADAAAAAAAAAVAVAAEAPPRMSRREARRAHRAANEAAPTAAAAAGSGGGGLPTYQDVNHLGEVGDEEEVAVAQAQASPVVPSNSRGGAASASTSSWRNPSSGIAFDVDASPAMEWLTTTPTTLPETQQQTTPGAVAAANSSKYTSKQPPPPPHANTSPDDAFSPREEMPVKPTITVAPRADGETADERARRQRQERNALLGSTVDVDDAFDLPSDDKEEEEAEEARNARRAKMEDDDDDDRGVGLQDKIDARFQQIEEEARGPPPPVGAMAQIDAATAGKEPEPAKLPPVRPSEKYKRSSTDCGCGCCVQ